MHKTDFDELVRRFENPERAQWQQVDAVIAWMGDVDGKTIVDLGAGTGYFSFPLAEAGAQVIAADVDERFLNYIEDKLSEKGLPGGSIETRAVPMDGPGLEPESIDGLLTVNVYHHLENREAYFAKVRRALRPGGTLWIVDFKKIETPVGPPMRMRLDANEVKRELEAAGFSAVEIDAERLPYQYLIAAQR